jgi:hypothetical protein
MTTSAAGDATTGNELMLQSLEVDPDQLLVGDGAIARGIVTLVAAAPAGGTDVDLFTDRPEVVTVPKLVHIPEGALSNHFELAVLRPEQRLAVEITAALAGGRQFAKLTLGPEPRAPAATQPLVAPPPNGEVTAPDVPKNGTTRPAQTVEPPVRVAPVSAAVTEIVDTWPDCGQSFQAALLIGFPAIPFIAMVATLAIYAAPAGSALALLDPVAVGIGTGVGIWLLIAVAARWVIRRTSADQVNNSAFSELRHRVGEIAARLSAANPVDDQGRIAAGQLQACLIQIRSEITRADPCWIRGTGYLSAWKLVHRAEEALLLLEPQLEVIGAALYDELRLVGAQITNNDQLLSKLRLAVAHLGVDATSYLSGQPGAVTPTTVGAAQATGDGAAALARIALRDVRQAVNEFRDDSWDAIVRTRNHLISTLTATGIATYLGLILAVTVNSQPRGTNLESNVVLAAASFYLVGAMVGLFNRLNSQSNTQNDVEDYGLTTVRLMLTPVLAGIAAVGGVFLVAAIAASGVSTAILGANSGSALTKLDAVFNLTSNPFSLILAAIFGLSPGMLIDALQDQAEKYKSALRSTNPQSH